MEKGRRDNNRYWIVQLNNKPANNFLHRMRRKVEWRNHAQCQKTRMRELSWEPKKKKQKRNCRIILLPSCEVSPFCTVLEEKAMYMQNIIRKRDTCVALTMKSCAYLYPAIVRGFSLLSSVITRKTVISCVNGVASDNNIIKSYVGE